MRFLTTFLLCLATISYGYSQSLSDAQKLKKLANPEYSEAGKYEDMLRILAKYYQAEVNKKEVSSAEVLEAYRDNPYLQEVVQLIEKRKQEAEVWLNRLREDIPLLRQNIKSAERELDFARKSLATEQFDLELQEQKYAQYKQQADTMSLLLDYEEYYREIRQQLEANNLPADDLDSSKLRTRARLLEEFNRLIDQQKNKSLASLREQLQQKRKAVKTAESQKIEAENKLRKALEESENAQALLRQLNMNFKSEEAISFLSTVKPAFSQEVISENALIIEQGSRSFQNNLIDATATFIAERMREELNAAFFRKFQQNMARYRLLTIFPNTYDLISNGNAFNYAITTQVLRSSFQQDLNQLLFNMPKLLGELNLDKINDKVKIAGAGVLLVSELRRGVHPTQLLSRLNREIRAGRVQMDSRFVKLFACAEIISNSLQNTQDSSKVVKTAWADQTLVSSIFNDPLSRQMYLGLLSQQLQDVLGKDVLSDDRALLSQELVNLSVEFYRVAQKIDYELSNLSQKAKNGQNIAFAEYLNAYKNIFDVVMFPLRNSFLIQKSKIIEDIQPYIDIQELIINTYLATEGKDYEAALSHTVILLKKLQVFDETKRSYLTNILKYGAFAVAVSKARSANEIKAAIKAVALPAGSSSIKRRSLTSISLNAYGGFSNGIEFLFNNRQLSDPQYNLGISAPVGIAFNWAWRRKLPQNAEGQIDRDSKAYQDFGSNYLYRTRKGNYKVLKGSSGSLFLSLVDLGAVVLYRFNDNRPLPEDIGFQQVFAPGLFYMHGIRNSPISWFVGGQLSPQLRQIEQVNNEVIRSNALRFNVGITVDIPIFSLYTRTERMD